MKPTWNNLVRLAYSDSGDKSLGQRVEVLTEIIGAKTPLPHITNDTVSNVLMALKAKGLSGATINRYLSIVSKVATLYQRGYDKSYVLLIPWQREGSGRFEWLKKEDQPKLIDYLVNNNLQDVALTVEILVATGMRLGEFLGLELSQVEDNWIRLWETKTKRPRSIPIEPVTAARLRGLIVKGLPEAHTIRRSLKAALKACGIEDNITPHSLRHTTATRLVQSGANLLTAGKYLGHRSLRTTQRYVHIEDKDLTEAMKLIV